MVLVPSSDLRIVGRIKPRHIGKSNIHDDEVRVMFCGQLDASGCPISVEYLEVCRSKKSTKESRFPAVVFDNENSLAGDFLFYGML